jgi:hypothetical protein
MDEQIEFTFEDVMDVIFEAQHNLKEQLSFEEGEGWWITPDGKSIHIPSRQTHSSMSEALVEKIRKKLSRPFTADEEELLIANPNALAVQLGCTRLRVYKSKVFVDWGHGKDNHIRR